MKKAPLALFISMMSMVGVAFASSTGQNEGNTPPERTSVIDSGLPSGASGGATPGGRYKHGEMYFGGVSGGSDANADSSASSASGGSGDTNSTSRVSGETDSGLPNGGAVPGGTYRQGGTVFKP